MGLCFDMLSELTETQSDQVVIFGDFNIPALCAKQNDFYNNVLHNFMSFNNLQQYNDVLNNHNCVLDLVMSNLTCAVPENAYYPALEIPIVWKHR